MMVIDYDQKDPTIRPLQLKCIIMDISNGGVWTGP